MDMIDAVREQGVYVDSMPSRLEQRLSYARIVYVLLIGVVFVCEASDRLTLRVDAVLRRREKRPRVLTRGRSGSLTEFGISISVPLR